MLVRGGGFEADGHASGAPGPSERFQSCQVGLGLITGIVVLLCTEYCGIFAFREFEVQTTVATLCCRCYTVTVPFPISYRDMYTPSSRIYPDPETGESLSDTLTSGKWDRSRPSNASKEVRPYDKNLPARGALSIRAIGGYKPNESNYQKL